MPSELLGQCILQHLHVQDDDYLYLIMEYLPGGDVMVSAQLLPLLLLTRARPMLSCLNP